jgi:hypothetical protein
MAPVKTMGLNVPKGLKEGVTGFPQEYNDTPGPRQDLNPDVVDNPDALPEPLAAPKRSAGATKVRGTRKAAGTRKRAAKK